MADEESTTVAETTETADVESTDPETALEDVEASFEDSDDSEDTESEEESDDTEENGFEDEGDTEEDEEEESEEAATSEEEAPEESPELSEEEQRKAHNREMAERRLAEKQAREADLVNQQRQYLAEAEDEKDAAFRQLQIDSYNNKVEFNTNKLTTAYEKAVKDFPILESDDPAIRAEVDAFLDAFQAQYVTVDAYGNPYDVRADLYPQLQNKADSIQRLTKLGAREQTKQKTKEKSKVTPTPNRAPKEPKKDPDLEGFDEEADRW